MSELGTILPPREALALLRDENRCPIISIDTEFAPDKPVCQATLHGVGVAGSLPDGTCTVGTFFPANIPNVPVPWDYLFGQLILPIFKNPRRTVVMHPLKVDMQVFRARGLREEDERCKLNCTMSMLHIHDENLPKGLKSIGETILGVEGLESYSQTRKSMKRLQSAGKKDVNTVLQHCWVTYKEHRKKSQEQKVVIDPSWPTWRQLVMMLPPKLRKKDVLAVIEPIITSSIMRFFKDQEDAIFARYGATDALLTLCLWHHLMRGIPGVLDPIPEEDYRLLELETEVCHPITTEMEEVGFKLDAPLLADIESALRTAIDEVRTRLQIGWGPSFKPSTEGDTFNPASSDQVAEIVWSVWQLRPPPWTLRDGEIRRKFLRKKDGLCTTGDEVMQYLITHDKKFGPKIADLMEFRRLSKMHTTYAVPLLQYATTDSESRVHASLWPVGARTGRFAASNPNTENVPRPDSMPWLTVPAGADHDRPLPGVRVMYKDKEKTKFRGWQVKSFRSAFVAKPGYKLVSADLMQVENRLVAHESQDPTLLKTFCEWDCSECGGHGSSNKPLNMCPQCNSPRGERDRTHPDQPALLPRPATDKEPARGGFCHGYDIHSMTGHTIGLMAKHGFAEGRRRSKVVNHAYNYGMGAKTMARRSGVKVKEAQMDLDGMDRAYPYVRARLHERVRRSVREHGYVVIFDGHKRRFFGPKILMDSNNFEEWEWEAVIREAVNVLAQGGTAVIVKRAMIAIRGRIRELAKTDARLKLVRLINNVHDELIYEAPESVADQVKLIVIEGMETAADDDLSVPIYASGACGLNWEEVH